MKSNESFSAHELRLHRPALDEAAAKTVSGSAGVEKAKVAEIKLQFASGSYCIDTDALAAKLLDAGVLGADHQK